nr:hypothetical protein [Tanacetum cinerariifolium]
MFKQKDKINGRMAKMFGLLKELTSSTMPEQMLVREEVRNPITKNINAISIFRIKKKEVKENNERARSSNNSHDSSSFLSHLEPRIDDMMRDFWSKSLKRIHASDRDSPWCCCNIKMPLRSLGVLLGVGLDPQTALCGMSIRYAPIRWCWIEEDYIDPIKNLSGVSVALMARFRVIS